MGFSSTKLNTKRNASIGKEERFRDYKLLERRTGALIGPGTYNEHFSRKQVFKGTCSIKILPMTKLPSSNNNGYIMVGNSLMYEPGLESSRYRSTANINGENFGINLRPNDLYGRPGTGMYFHKTRKNDQNENFGIVLKGRSSRPHTARSQKIYGCSSSHKNAFNLIANSSFIN